MATKNEVTGDSIVSKPATDAFREGWDRIFGYEPPEVIVEPTADGGITIFAGSKVFVKLSKEQYQSLVTKILNRITAEQVWQAIEEYQKNA